MFPLHDNIKPRTFPWATYTFIALCSAVFLLQMASGEQGQEFVEKWGMIPARVTANESVASTQYRDVAVIVDTPIGPQRVIERRPVPMSDIPPWATLLTCMFLHGGLMHFAGNMWFLHIFGDNVEDRFGHFFYIVLYLGAGLAAGVAHLWSNPDSMIPTIGASGAIAGVMGAYILLYPKAVVETLIPLPILFTTFPVPAPVFLGIWFAIQIVQGASADNSSGGVAWWAHVGGFIAGAAAAAILMVTHIAKPPVQPYRNGASHSGFLR